MKVYGYIRVSSSGQAKDGYSLDAQRRAIVNYCHRNRAELIETFSDEGISGVESKISDRHGLLAMLSCLGEVEGIVVANTSRLWRDDIAKALIKREFLHYNLELLSIEQATYKITTADPSEFLVNGMLELLDQFIKMQLVMTMEKGRLEKLRKGGFPGGGIPLGYRVSEGDLEDDEDERKVVELIFKLRKSGNGFQKIANYLNNKGKVGKKGGKFYKSTIKKILLNRKYIGELIYGSHKVKGSHPVLISKTTFARANTAQKLQKVPSPSSFASSSSSDPCSGEPD